MAPFERMTAERRRTVAADEPISDYALHCLAEQYFGRARALIDVLGSADPNLRDGSIYYYTETLHDMAEEMESFMSRWWKDTGWARWAARSSPDAGRIPSDPTDGNSE